MKSKNLEMTHSTGSTKHWLNDQNDHAFIFTVELTEG
jgi:hypothetical protein